MNATSAVYRSTYQPFDIFRKARKRRRADIQRSDSPSSLVASPGKDRSQKTDIDIEYTSSIPQMNSSRAIANNLPFQLISIGNCYKATVELNQVDTENKNGTLRRRDMEEDKERRVQKLSTK